MIDVDSEVSAELEEQISAVGGVLKVRVIR